MRPATPIFDKVRQLLKEQWRGRDHSIDWYQKKVAEVNTSPAAIMRQGGLTPDIFIGKLFLFWYDAKHKATLPYFDRFPLVIPVGITEDGFYGLNFHYLPVKYRVALLDKLLEFANNQRMDKTTKLKATYEMLVDSTKYPEVAPCLKRYLGSQIESQFLAIDAKDWVTSVFLPVERFTVSKEIVWKDSLKLMRRKPKGAIRTKRANKIK